MKLFGKTLNNKQRYRCLKCLKTYIWQRPCNKEQHWFKLWIKEGYSVRQLTKLSGHSKSKIERIKNYWLSKEPPALSLKYSAIKYLAFDGTYFHKKGCLALFINIKSGKPVYYSYIQWESYENVLPLVLHLRDKNIYPIAITTDGHQKVIYAIKTVWKKVIVQRCLFHIQNQGLMWLRTYPKSEAGKELRKLFTTIAKIRTKNEMNVFKTSYTQWLFKYKIFISTLPKYITAYKDLKRAMSLINNALPNMFHFIADKNIAATTNILESFYSQLKHQYVRHRGLSEQHKISYLKWFCYFKTIKN